MLVLICKEFKIENDSSPLRIESPETELLVDYAIDSETMETVVVPCEHPQKLGAHFDYRIGEWVILD